jgi:hypothetical protein
MAYRNLLNKVDPYNNDDPVRWKFVNDFNQAVGLIGNEHDTDREARLQIVSRVIGQPLGSFKTLGDRQVAALKKLFEDEVAAKQVRVQYHILSSTLAAERIEKEQNAEREVEVEDTNAASAV